MDSDWQKTFELINNTKDAAAQKLVTWIYVTETNMPIPVKEMMAFVNDNPGWPQLYKFRAKIEKTIADEKIPAHDLISWFDQNPPNSAAGISVYLTALLSSHHEEQARKALGSFWQDAVLSKQETSSLAEQYKNIFTKKAHAERMDHLIFEQRYSEAEYMMPLLEKDVRALNQARMLLGRQSSKAGKALKEVPDYLQNDSGLLYERLRWRRRKDLDDAALQMIDAMPSEVRRPDLWWEEIQILARRAIEEKNYRGAYAIINRCPLKEGGEYAQAQWLLGWLSLNHLKQPEQAYLHFDHFYGEVQTAISKARGAYWAAKAGEILKKPDYADKWYKISAQYLSTFYGQISYQKIYGVPDAKYLQNPVIDKTARTVFEQKDLVRSVKLLQDAKLDRLIPPFLAKLNDLAKTRQDHALAAQLAIDTHLYYYAVQANKDLQQKTGEFLFDEGYPTTPSLDVAPAEQALIYAVIHRESMFDHQAVSPAGAKGLMQLMPHTAKSLSKRHGIAYTPQKLVHDPAYNIKLGAGYLKQLMKDYDGFYPLVLAAYNAGPSRVKEWIDEFGDPRKKGTDLVDWIEHIPNYETRNYIQRVLESYYMYQLKLSLPPKTVADFARK